MSNENITTDGTNLLIDSEQESLLKDDVLVPMESYTNETPVEKDTLEEKEVVDLTEPISEEEEFVVADENAKLENYPQIKDALTVLFCEIESYKMSNSNEVSEVDFVVALKEYAIAIEEFMKDRSDTNMYTVINKLLCCFVTNIYVFSAQESYLSLLTKTIDTFIYDTIGNTAGAARTYLGYQKASVEAGNSTYQDKYACLFTSVLTRMGDMGAMVHVIGLFFSLASIDRKMKEEDFIDLLIENFTK